MPPAEAARKIAAGEGAGAEDGDRPGRPHEMRPLQRRGR